MNHRPDRSGTYPRQVEPAFELVLLVACSAVASIVALIIVLLARCS